MGRKIPGKKHHGVKDPIQQLARRNADPTLNSAPKHPDEQEIPKRVLEIERLKKVAQKMIEKKKNKKKRKMLSTENFSGGGPVLPGMTKDEKKLPTLVQWPGESDQSFLHRINEATDDIINEAQLEDNFGVTVTRNKEGKVERVEDDVSVLEDQKIANMIKNKHKTRTKTKATEDSEDKPKRSLNRRQRLKMKKKAKLELENGQKDFRSYSDHVKFGEVVHRPPQLTARPKGGDTSLSSKPGKKNLLLKGIFGNNARKSQSMASIRRLESERAKAVEAYRALKARRNQER